MRPLLFSAVRISSRRRFRAWSQGRKDEATVLIRELFVDFEFGRGPAPDFDSFVNLRSTLCKLVMTGFLEVLDISGLAQLTSKAMVSFVVSFPVALKKTDCPMASDLSTLQLSSIEVTSSESKPLPNVQVLNLDNVTSPLASKTFTSKNFPALCCLAWYNINLTHKEELDIFQELEPHLEALSLNRGTGPKELEAKLKEKTLFDSTFGEKLKSAFDSVKYLRIYYNNSQLAPGLIDGALFGHLASAIARCRKEGKGVPFVIYLPLAFQDEFLAQEDEDSIDLFNECSISDVELVFEQQPTNWQVDSGISLDFWRRMRKLKAMKGAE
ncbi:hypothetical protein JCM5350_001269 [Sporobolomyces pararoseus]